MHPQWPSSQRTDTGCSSGERGAGIKGGSSTMCIRDSLSIDKNTNEGKNYRNNVVKSTPGTSKSRINTGFPEDISVLSPMMREYCKTKESYMDCILFYRLGDFYEMFLDSSKDVASRVVPGVTTRITSLLTRPFAFLEMCIRDSLHPVHGLHSCSTETPVCRKFHNPSAVLPHSLLQIS